MVTRSHGYVAAGVLAAGRFIREIDHRPHQASRRELDLAYQAFRSRPSETSRQDLLRAARDFLGSGAAYHEVERSSLEVLESTR